MVFGPLRSASGPSRRNCSGFKVQRGSEIHLEAHLEHASRHDLRRLQPAGSVRLVHTQQRARVERVEYVEVALNAALSQLDDFAQTEVELDDPLIDEVVVQREE